MFAEIINGIAKLERGEEAHAYYARPSSAGPERCIRRMTYHALGVEPKPIPGRGVLTMDDSSWHEELTFDWLAKSVYQIHSRQMGVEVDAPGLNRKGFFCSVCNRQVAPERIHGHIDGMCTDPMGEDVLIEHKALSTWGVKRYEKGEELPLDYIAQGCIYVKGAHAINPKLGRLCLIIKDKNTAQYFEYEILYDVATDQATVVRSIKSYGDAPAIVTMIGIVLDRVVESALEKFRAVEAYRVAGTVPDRPYDFGTDFPCGYCAYEATCWETYEQEFEARARGVEMDAETVLICLEEREASESMKQSEKVRDELRKQIKDRLKAQDARSGVAGDYLIDLSLRNRKAYTVEPTTYEQLTIKMRKKETTR